jgi:hypothetical protein
MARAVKLDDIIFVTISGKAYPTKIDEHGVQRFLPAPLIPNDPVLIEYLNKGNENGAFAAYKNRRIPYREYLEYEISLGWSVTGLCDLFPYANVQNPLW